MPNTANRDLLALCALRLDKASIDWSLVAREVTRRPDGLASLLEGQISEQSAAARESQELLGRMLKDDGIALGYKRADDELALADSVGARLVTVFDDEYPKNLRLIWNLPPFLFVRGTPITDVDIKSVAVVGTRKPSPRGVRFAQRIADALATAGVTVVSGLAAGIDTAAHTATLDAGGRTIAVIGTGIARAMFPAENAELAERIVETGALVSQFWPSTSPAKWTFPRRNVVMSGLAQGTVVVEASSTSGAKMQARLATEHGKKVFLLQTLVTDQKWARTYVAERGAIEVTSVDDILTRLAEPDKVADVTEQRQLALDF